MSGGNCVDCNYFGVFENFENKLGKLVKCNGGN